MSQPRRIPSHFVLSRNQSGAAVPNEESHSRLLTLPDTIEQMELNISSATQVGHQLAIIGDEFNSTYTRKLEDMLFHLAQGKTRWIFSVFRLSSAVLDEVSALMAVNVLKILHMHVWESFRSLLNNGWTKRTIAYGSWISRLLLKSMCLRLMPAALFVILFWWTVGYGLQN